PDGALIEAPVEHVAGVEDDGMHADDLEGILQRFPGSHRIRHHGTSVGSFEFPTGFMTVGCRCGIGVCGLSGGLSGVPHLSDARRISRVGGPNATGNAQVSMRTLEKMLEDHSTGNWSAYSASRFFTPVKSGAFFTTAIGSVRDTSATRT